MRRIGFILKPRQDNEARKLLYELAEWTRSKGLEAIVLAEDRVNPQGSILVPEIQLAESVDICVVLGGDGTMLRACNAVAGRDIPLLGINLGRLGFLSPYDPADAKEILQKAIDGELPTAKRMRLSITYKPAIGECVHRNALNDVVISQGAMARLVELQAHLNDCFINSYRADGLVVCSPTGSTAYNLAANGPIMYPGLRAMAITPICAQGLTNRPLLVPADGIVRISMNGESRGVVLTIDGQWARSFETGDIVEITAAPEPVTIFSSDHDYFNILRAKLHWGVGPIL